MEIYENAFDISCLGIGQTPDRSVAFATIVVGVLNLVL